ncbi:flagellin [Clostridium sp. MSJ-11]|uniref:Flagellin n=1 Tax=Clostridium mobile TaxID=2841512 RepID=A0ABS6EH92_9CLOT|nr:flagellin [Clostridium mobile]MBU5484378.1 flagellin [Clostridium mobile]
MITNHNMAQLIASNRANAAGKAKSNAMERLASGLRINKAADDAAGSGISQKMRAQIRGLEQANRNIQDGVSLVQTAEGGLNEITDDLQKMRELAVQASNRTLADDDRSNIQQEIEQLTSGIDDIANNTEFNGLALLAGEYDKDGNISESDSLDQYVDYVTTSGGITNKYTYTYNGKTENYESAIIDFSNINSADDVDKLVGKGVNYTCCTCNAAYSIKFVDGNPDTSRLNTGNPVMEVDVSSVTPESVINLMNKWQGNTQQ